MLGTDVVWLLGLLDALWSVPHTFQRSEQASIVVHVHRAGEELGNLTNKRKKECDACASLLGH